MSQISAGSPRPDPHPTNLSKTDAFHGAMSPQRSVTFQRSRSVRSTTLDFSAKLPIPESPENFVALFRRFCTLVA